MTLPIDDIIFKSRALAQTHPFTRRAQAYVNSTVARERDEQELPNAALWVSNALTVGYCLRRIEESDNGLTDSWNPGEKAGGDAPDLDEITSRLAEKIQSEQASDFLLYPPEFASEALDRMIEGEVQRRLAELFDKLDGETFEQLESYIAWWTVKGYTLRVAEQMAAAKGGAK